MNPEPQPLDIDVPLMKKPLYAVLFSSSENLDEPYLPIVFGPQDATQPHGLDRDMIPAIPGLWYCLHLPNNLYELIDMPLSAIKKSQDLELDHSHLILVCPIQAFQQDPFQWPDAYVPALTICPDELLDEGRVRARNLGFAMEAVGYSALSDESLRLHWREIHRLFGGSTDYLGREPWLSSKADRLATDLPKRWLARQIDAPSSDREDSRAGGGFEEAMQHQVALSAIARLEEDDLSPAAAKERMKDALREESSRVRVPTTIALPGVPTNYVRKLFGDQPPPPLDPVAPVKAGGAWASALLPDTDSDIEDQVIQFLVAHRAIARTGVGLVLPPVPDAAFHMVARLEDHLRGTPRPHVVWRMLRQLDALCAPIMTDSFKLAVSRASMITAFTNFPLGLLGLSDDMDPLCCRVPITYRPLLPLTASVQQELRPPTTIDLTDGLRVLIAECIPSDDPVGRASRTGWDVALDLAEQSKFSVEILHEDANSVSDIAAMISRHNPHVLVLSAHGIFDTNTNLAGIRVGEEACLGPELGDVPPVVLLSACSVAPRGIGSVNIADMLLRQGAFAVLGAQIPVNVGHNATLMVRFLIYMLESLMGNEPHMTLLDVWHRARTSNAIIDILGGNAPLNNWGYTPDPTGATVLQRFMNSTSKDRLRVGHIYADSEEVLGEIADAQGMGAQVRSWLRRPGYVPESLFYAFIGRPERVHLQHNLELPGTAE
jgi:hypothetical protein